MTRIEELCCKCDLPHLLLCIKLDRRTSECTQFQHHSLPASRKSDLLVLCFSAGEPRKASLASAYSVKHLND